MGVENSWGQVPYSRIRVAMEKPRETLAGSCEDESLSCYGTLRILRMRGPWARSVTGLRKNVWLLRFTKSNGSTQALWNPVHFITNSRCWTSTKCGICPAGFCFCFNVIISYYVPVLSLWNGNVYSVSLCVEVYNLFCNFTGGHKPGIVLSLRRHFGLWASEPCCSC